MSFRTTAFGLALAASVLAAPAFAATAGFVTTDLNLRAGPSSNTEVLTAIPVNSNIAIDGCIEGGNWCQVNYNGTQGWAFAEYLAADLNGQRVVVRENIGPLGIAAAAFTGTLEAIGDTAGALVRGTADAVADVVSPPEERIVYVRDNRVDPVYFDREITVGDGLPETVEIREVPDYDYGYTYVNGQPVFVDRTSRRVVYVVR